MTRAARQKSEKIEMVVVGETDEVSRAARIARVSLCTAIQPKSRRKCTRAAGHDESEPGHPATKHVATGVAFLVTAVW